MSPLDAAKAFFEKAKDMAKEDLLEALKQLPAEVQVAYRKYKRASYFAPENAGKKVEKVSPSGKYKLLVTSFETTKGSWSFTQGEVFRQGSDTPIATVQRNYHSFPFLFVEGHPKGDFLVCGEDYQGQTVVELSTGKRRELLPEEAKKGHGFCWASSTYVPSMQALQVDGCYWAAPYEYRFYDFSDPMNGWPQIGADVCIDEDRREPTLEADGTIKVYQTAYRSDEEAENDDEDAPEPLGDIAAFTVYRREGLNLVEVEAWVSDKEKDRRRRNEEASERHEKWLANFKATDPLHLTMLEEVKDPVLKPADYISIGVTYDKWCPDFTKQEKRICRRIHDKGKSKTGYTFDLEWAAETGPVKLVVYKDGQTSEDKFFMDHSIESMKAAFAYAKSLLS